MVKGRFGKFALVCLSVFLTVLVLEGMLRWAGFSYPNFYATDYYAGMKLRPGAEGWWRSEGEAFIKINSAGYRDREHRKIKPRNVIRIAVLGDSYAEALQVPLEDTFWAVLEQEIKRCPSILLRNVEVLNFGVSGYGTAQELMTLRHHVWEYSPDLVLLAFLTANDVRNNLLALERDSLRPYFVYDGKGDLLLDVSFRNTWGFRLRQWRYLYLALDHSRVLQLMNMARHRLRARIAWSNGLKFLESGIAEAAKDRDSDVDPGRNAADGDAAVYMKPSSPLWQEAWRVTEGIILMMRDEVRMKGADFLIVTLTNGDQVHPSVEQRRAAAQALNIEDLLYPDLRIADFARRHGIEVLTLVPEFRRHAEQNGVYLHGFPNGTLGGGHWNRTGHYLAGRLIADKVCPWLQAASAENKERMP